MIQPDNIDDATLEYAAQLVEQGGLISDIAGIMAKRKRDREDADLRMRARRELRAELAAHLRAMMSRDDLSAVTVLRRLSELGEHDHVAHLRDAWPLAWKGWLTITAAVNCGSNWIPPEIHYRIALTERGATVLKSGSEQP